MTSQTLTRPGTSAKQAGSRPDMPHLVCAGTVEAIEFYKEAFGAVELKCEPDNHGEPMHAAVRISGATIMLVDEEREWRALSPQFRNRTPVTVHLHVDDADAIFDRAVKSGATIKVPLANMFWGDRCGVLVDPFGHSWSIATRLRA